jgi:hypothetical protein
MPLKVVNQGEQDFLGLILAPSYVLKLFKSNTTLTEALTPSSLTEADFTGYSAKTLTGGAWTIAAGDPASGQFAQQSFVSTADQTAQTVYGYYIVTTGGSPRLQWVERFASAIVVQYNNDSIRITPRITLADTTD